MPLTVVVGGQFGGEGKGLITAYIAKHDEIDVLVKVGGPNSAHSFGVAGAVHQVRMLPSGANLGPSEVFPAGCLIHIDSLFSEIESLKFAGRLLIDRNAGVVDASHVEDQRADGFYQQVGSTLTGTGYATASRARRRLRLAKDEPRLHDCIADTSLIIRDHLVSGHGVLVEGAQAYGLSNYHGQYPYVSSRDTTVNSFLAQIGLGPRFLDSTIVVIKCFPTRNQGGGGDLSHELKRRRNHTVGIITGRVRGRIIWRAR
jgi:adenylosuccinate synthase